MTRKFPQRDARGGFLTLGLILCLILILTAAAVLWNYQFLTIQNQELYYAGRSAVQGAMAGYNSSTWTSSAVTTSVTPNARRLFNANTSRLNRNTDSAAMTVAVNGNQTTFTVTENRQLHFFQGIFSQNQRDVVEKEGTNSAKITHTFYVTNDGTTLRLSHKP